MSTSLVATLDGTLVDADQPLIHADDLGLLRGDGVFETTLVVDGEPRDLDEHLARLAVSAGMIGLSAPPESDWRRGIDAVVAGWRIAPDRGREMVLRLICSRGREHGGDPTALVLAGAINPHVAVERSSGISVLTLPRGFAGPEVAALPWLLPGAKTLSYAVNMAAKRHAEANGADDVIFVGTDGCILEGPTATVVVADGNNLHTPPDAGILAGITVQRLFREAAKAGLEPRITPLSAEDLRTADGIWLVSGVRLLAPVIAVDGTPRPVGRLHETLSELLDVPHS